MQQNAFKIFSAALLGGAGFLPLGAQELPQRSDPFSSTTSSQLEEAAAMTRSGNILGSADNLRILAARQIPLSTLQDEEALYLLGRDLALTSDSLAPAALRTFLDKYPASLKANEARILLADYYFFRHDYSQALPLYAAADLSTLPSDSRRDASVRMAICCIREGKFDEGRRLLRSLPDAKRGVKNPVVEYYEAYIDYAESRDREALEKFRHVSQSLQRDSSGRLAKEYALYPDYYIAQLLFRMGDYNGCIKLSRSLLRRGQAPEPALWADTQRVLGMSLYESGDLLSAQGSLAAYVEAAGDKADADALYALGACDYEAGDYDAALSHLSPLLDSNDVIGQGAALYVGQIEARRGNPSAALLNFEKAWRMNYDNALAEAALYNYIAASAKGGSIPFDSSRDMLLRFIETYPHSEYAPAVERHLAELCYRQGEYDEALKAIRRISNPTTSDLRLKQAILYGAGCAALSSGKAQRASELLQECVSVPGADREISLQAYIWLGDALYQRGDYAAAERAYKSALSGGSSIPNADLARYGLGYSLFMQKKFGQAERYFSGYSSSFPSDMGRDAAMRRADIHYYTGDYSRAREDFESLRQSGGRDADYAAYRHAQLLGLSGQTARKIEALEDFSRNYSNSKWWGEAMTELGDTYSEQDDWQRASAAYSRVAERNPVGANTPRALLGLASARMNAGDSEAAEEAYRTLLTQFSASDEARIADKELRRLYAEERRLNEYAAFLRGVPGYSLDASEIDDLAFEAAQNDWLDNDDASGVLDYIREYPSGRHIADAYSIAGEYYLDKSDYPNALAAYRELEQRGGAQYAAEAYAGIMRSANNTALRLEYANRLRESGAASADVLDEADLYIGKSMLESKERAVSRKGIQLLERLAENPFSDTGAQAAVELGEYELRSGNPAAARKRMESFTSSGSDNAYWTARGFIVLADALTAQGNDYLAKEYLRSLRDNYPGSESDIRRMIQQRLSSN